MPTVGSSEAECDHLLSKLTQEILRIYLLFSVNIPNTVFVSDYWKKIFIYPFLNYYLVHFFFPGKGGMNLERHDKEFQLERMIGKINSAVDGRQHKLKIEKNEVPWEPSEMATTLCWPKIRNEK